MAKEYVGLRVIWELVVSDLCVLFLGKDVLLLNYAFPHAHRGVNGYQLISTAYLTEGVRDYYPIQ